VSDDEEPPERYADTDLAGFWIDTRCVPLEPNDLRINQIRKMRHIYKNASCVLVLDRWVQEVATTADISEKFAPVISFQLAAPALDVPRGCFCRDAILPVPRRSGTADRANGTGGLEKKR
jgi:hypothetical protein